MGDVKVRYTRYNYKPPRKKNNFMLVFILILIAAITLGTIFSKLLPKYNSNAAVEKATKIGLEKEGQTTKDGVDASKAIAVGSTKEYVALQCGIFSKKENAIVLKNSLMKFGTPFIIEEDNLIRVLFGIYPKESIDSITKQLQANKIEYIKINFKLIGKDATSHKSMK